MSAGVFPKAMRHKKAALWLADHPGVDPVAFWLDQSDKLNRSSARAWRVVIICLSISFVAQVVGIVVRVMSL